MTEINSFSASLIVALVGCLMVGGVCPLKSQVFVSGVPNGTADPSNSPHTCPVTELNLFGVNFQNPVAENRVCPGIPKNCCGQLDIERIELGFKASEQRQTNYYAMMLAMHRYILGLSHMYVRLAKTVFKWSQAEKFRRMELKKHPNSDKVSREPIEQPSEHYILRFHKTCETAAYKLLTLEFKERIYVQRYYEALVQRFEFLKRARRGVYCSFCSADVVEYFQRPSDDKMVKTRVNAQFCQKFFDWTYHTVTQNYLLFSIYLRYLLTMLSCVAPRRLEAEGRLIVFDPNDFHQPNDLLHPERVPYSVVINLKVKNPLESLPVRVRATIEKPMLMKREFYMRSCHDSVAPNTISDTKCYEYCKHMDFFKANKVVDGDIEAMYRVYKHLQQFEFFNPNIKATSFADRLEKLKDSIEDGFRRLGKDYVFLRNYKDFPVPVLSKMSYTLDANAMQPLEFGRQSSLQLISLGEGLVEVGVAAFILMWWERREI